jgi:kynurenine 3-monooxygenase
MRQVVMMRGRSVHDIEGNNHFLRYGKDDSEVIWSVHRGRLNLALIEAAEQQGVHIQFGAKIEQIDMANQIFNYIQEGINHSENYQRLIASDGAGSSIRYDLVQKGLIKEKIESLGHNYRELEIAPDQNNDFKLDANALHIWPRGGFMCIALPNTEKTFTVTLFLPAQGETSFAAIQSPAEARVFFEKYFPDALNLVEDFDNDWQNNPESSLSTLYLNTWHYQDSIVLLGDAAHAMVPFHGQGMNCAFEDCLAMVEAIDQQANWSNAIAAFEAARMNNAAAIQAMALENYVEMRDKVDDAQFLLQRTLERQLAELHPERFVPRYSMVSFQRVDYATALARGKIQRQILQTLTEGISDTNEVDFVRASKLIHQQLEPLRYD